MSKIITIARQMGSGGKTVGEMLAKDLGIKFYDKEIAKLASEKSGIHEKYFGLNDEKLNSPVLRKQNIYTGKMIEPDSADFLSEKNIFNYFAKVITTIADNESAVIVGRCADFILRDRKDVIKVFIFSDFETAIKNVIEKYGISEKEAKKLIERKDKERSSYYKYFTGNEWDSARNYDICLDTSRLNYQKCLDIIKGYIKILDD